MKKIELLKYLLLFIVTFSLFSYFQISPTFPDPDSFYHAKMAVLTRDQGIISDFPWLQFTVLKNNYTDHHFLYHVALIPFVTVLDPLVGIKLATAFFAAILILVFYWFLKKFRVKGAIFYSLILLASSPFIFRINLAKASSISLIILFFGLYFIFKRKLWPLFALSFIYVWTYGGWPLILVLTLFYIFSEAVIGVAKNFENVKSLIKAFFKNIFSKANVKLFGACFGGLVAGIVLNPFFPKNLVFYWQQIIKIAVINYQDKIGVGAEWYPYGLGDLVANSSFIFILLILSFAVIFINFLKNFTSHEKSSVINPEMKVKTLTLTFLALFFLALTLRSRRNVEYFIPFAALASAFILNQPLSLIKKYLPAINAWRQKRKILSSLAIIYILFMVPFTAGRNIWSIKQLYLSGGSIYKYRGVAEWLKKNTPEGAIVFHNDWDDFPALFYYNTHNYYIAGLDPTFMYDYDKDLHKDWVDITTGRRPNISEIVKNDFHSEYVFVDKDHIALENNLKSDGHFQMVYKDEEGKIYKLIEKQ
ncbi:MAG: hypothetical protein ABII19_02600 [Patescibacteria group bacterium]